MRISHRHKFIFFSNPKTGSESVRALLDPYSDVVGIPMWEITQATPFYAHISPAEARAQFIRLGWDYETYYSFTFVRNPWARLVSLYQMIHRERAGRMSRVTAVARRLSGLAVHPTVHGFRSWLTTIRPDGVGGGGPGNQRWQRYGAYSIRAYAFNQEGLSLVRKIVRLEDIDSDLPLVMKEIGLPIKHQIEIPRVNVYGRTSYTEYYDATSRFLVGKLYAYDIQQYGYVFGE